MGKVNPATVRQGTFFVVHFVSTISENRTSSELSHDIPMDLPKLPSDPRGFKKLNIFLLKGRRYIASFRFDKVKSVWKNLNFAQRCYVGATILLLLLLLLLLFDVLDASNAVAFGIPVTFAIMGYVTNSGHGLVVFGSICSARSPYFFSMRLLSISRWRILPDWLTG